MTYHDYGCHSPQHRSSQQQPPRSFSFKPRKVNLKISTSTPDLRRDNGKLIRAMPTTGMGTGKFRNCATPKPQKATFAAFNCAFCGGSIPINWTNAGACDTKRLTSSLSHFYDCFMTSKYPNATYDLYSRSDQLPCDPFVLVASFPQWWYWSQSKTVSVTTHPTNKMALLSLHELGALTEVSCCRLSQNDRTFSTLLSSVTTFIQCPAWSVGMRSLWTMMLSNTPSRFR